MLSKLLGWEPCGIECYREACAAYGFNAESDPDFIAFQMELGAQLTFIAYRKHGRLLGAACLDRGWLANDKTRPQRASLNLPIPADAVHVPFDDSVKCIAPFKSKCLHPLNLNFVNSTFGALSKRQICLAKSPASGFSKKTVATREREVRRLLQDGGELRDFSTFGAGELQDIYWELYKLRRNEYPMDRDNNRLFFERFHERMLGDVLFYKGAPCAMQLNVCTESKSGLFVDYINMGLDTRIEEHSLGTILIWSNLKKAQDLADLHGRKLYYSFGNPSAAYKDRWCEKAAIGKLFYP